MKKISLMLAFIFIISVFSGCADKIDTPDASTDNINADSAAITTEAEESSVSQSRTEESTAEETADATAESAEQTPFFRDYYPDGEFLHTVRTSFNRKNSNCFSWRLTEVAQDPSDNLP